jgi:hypothetical protein
MKLRVVQFSLTSGCPLAYAGHIEELKCINVKVTDRYREVKIT